MATTKNRFRPSDTYYAFHKAFFPEDTTKPVRVFFVDTETSGIDCNTDQILQFSGISYDFIPETKELIERSVLDIFIKNKAPIPAEVSKVNHITKETLENAPEEPEAFRIISDFMKNIDVFCAYNEPFDFGFIQMMYENYGRFFSPKVRFDVMAMARDLITVYQSQLVKLSSICKYLKVDGEFLFHNSLDDIRATARVFQKLFDKYSAIPEPPDCSAMRTPKIWRHWFWNNPQASKMQRIYFQTDCGRLFYEKLDRSFGVDQKNCGYKMEELNMEAFAKQAVRYLGCDRLEDLTHLKPPKEEKTNA